MSCQKSTLTDERIIELLWCIPDHGFSDTARKYMTEDLYNTLEESFSIPPSCPGYIGDEEFLFYFIHGNGGIPSYEDRHPSVRVLSFTDETHAEARVKYSGVHKLSLVFENGRWVLDDFDNKKYQCKEYNRTH